jgi:hypothetical protein
VMVGTTPAVYTSASYFSGCMVRSA